MHISRLIALGRDEAGRHPRTGAQASQIDPLGVGWIKGDLYRLEYKGIARVTINRILRDHGFKPELLGDPDNTLANLLRDHALPL